MKVLEGSVEEEIARIAGALGRPGLAELGRQAWRFVVSPALSQNPEPGVRAVPAHVLAAASIYIAARRTHVPVGFRELISAAARDWGEESKVRSKVWRVVQAAHSAAPELAHLDGLPTPASYLDSLISKLREVPIRYSPGSGKEVYLSREGAQALRRVAASVLSQAPRPPRGGIPAVWAAAAVYEAGRRVGIHIAMRTLALVIGVTEPTIRRYWEELRAELGGGE